MSLSLKPERIKRYKDDERFKGWQGLRTPEKSARHRAGHAKKRSSLTVVS